MTSPKRKLLLFFALFIILFLSFYRNQFGIAADEFYARFQHDSESLVIGRIVADQNGLAFPKETNLGFSSIRDFSYNPTYIYQGYALVGNRVLEDLSVTTLNINDENWSGGVAKNFSGLVISQNPGLDAYVGRKIFVDNQSRIITSITHGGGFTNIYISGEKIAAPQKGEVLNIRISGDKYDSSDIHLEPYISQFGIQGVIFSKLNEVMRGKINDLYKVNSALLALAIVVLFVLYLKIFPKQFAVIFLISILLSPWMTSFGKNLYWIPFSWFLPAVFSAGYLLTTSSLKKWLCLFSLYLAFLFKCLAGYEYISAIILLAACPFVFQMLLSSKNGAWRLPFKRFMLVCLVGVAAFITALLIHADIRGETIWSGLQSIYEFDVKRRTYGNPAAFGPEYFTALSSTPVDILRMYVFSWHTELLRFLPGGAFVILLLGAILTLLCRYLILKTHKSFADLAIFVAFILPPVSWLILAKGHSAIHTHINYVLWYFGFVAALLHICFNGLKLFTISVSAWALKTRLDEV